jgi:hypothetical protein
VNQSIKDGVGVSGLADQAMSAGDGNLAGDKGGLAAVAGLEDVQQVEPGPWQSLSWL